MSSKKTEKTYIWGIDVEVEAVLTKLLPILVSFVDLFM